MDGGLQVPGEDDVAGWTGPDATFPIESTEEPGGIGEGTVDLTTSEHASGIATPDPVLTRASKRRSRGTVVAATSVVLVVAVGVVVGVTSGSSSAPSHAPSGSPNRVVLTAIDSTLGAKTADLRMTLTISVPGQPVVTATGNGSVDFANDATQVNLVYNGAPGVNGMQVTERYTGGNAYLSLPQISTVLPGKSWVDVPIGSSTLTAGSSNPAALFQILQSEGDVVTPLGTSVVNGASVQGYHVMITEAGLQKRLGETNLPPDFAQTVQGMFGSGGLQMDVFVSDANGMVARVAVDMHMSVAGQSIAAKVVEDTSNFGVPVTVTAPPADQVASYQEFTQAASGSVGTPTGG